MTTNLAVILRLLNEKPKRHILSESVRKVLHSRGLKKIRQSAYAMGRECPNKLMLAPIADESASGIHALCGSVFHLLLSSPIEALDNQYDEGYYWRLFLEIRQKDPGTVYLYRGQPVDKSFIKKLCLLFSTRERTGLTLGELAHECHLHMIRSGISITKQEIRYSHLDSGKYPIEHHGTGDIEAELLGSGKLALGDCKSSGLWDAYFSDDGNVKAVSMKSFDVQFHSQLRHYNWLRSIDGAAPADYHFILAPVNLIPYKDPKKKGLRGQPIFLAPSLGSRGNLAYELDYIRFFESFTSTTPYRAYPSNWGSLSCPTCPYFRACLADLDSAADSVLFNDPRLAYLRQSASGEEPE